MPHKKMQPLRLLTTAKLDWFDDGCCDVKYLDIWQQAPISYRPGQPTDSSWHVDEHKLSLGHDEDGRLFHKAKDLLMRYHFYPPDVMSHVSDFGLYERWAQVGDRIVQRIHLLSLFGKPVLDVIGMTEISRVIAEPRRAGFTYLTVKPHVEQGEWTACVEWSEAAELVLTLESISKPITAEPARNYGFMRARQKAAHRRGLDHFKHSLLI